MSEGNASKNSSTFRPKTSSKLTTKAESAPASSSTISPRTSSSGTSSADTKAARSSSTSRTTGPAPRPLSSGTGVYRGDQTTLVYALSSKKPLILRALAEWHYTRPAFLDAIEIDGLPGIERVSLFAWPEPPGRPTRIGVDVVRVDESILDYAVTFGLDLKKSEWPVPPAESDNVIVAASEIELDFDDSRPSKIKIDHVEWYLCANAGVQREVRELKRDGQPIFQDVDTSVYCYKLICPRCGRARYAKRNSIHQILYCRVCTRQGRLRNRALVQFRERERTNTRRRIPPHQQDEVVARTHAGESRTAIADSLGMTPSGVTKILKRKGVA